MLFFLMVNVVVWDSSGATWSHKFGQSGMVEHLSVDTVDKLKADGMEYTEHDGKVNCYWPSHVFHVSQAFDPAPEDIEVLPVLYTNVACKMQTCSCCHLFPS